MSLKSEKKKDNDNRGKDLEAFILFSHRLHLNVVHQFLKKNLK